MKTILITGASRGIGAEIARLAYCSGKYNIIINCNKSEDRANSLKDALIEYSANNDKTFGRIEVIKADVSKEDEVEVMFEKSEQLFGSVDILVNNAGISSFSLFTDLSYEKWNEILSVNLGSVFLCSKRALGNMIRKKSGKIINISSIWGICGSSCEVHYSTSKAAIIGLTKALAKEVAPSGITVNCVAPGVIDTEMNNILSEKNKEVLKEETPLGKIGTVTDVAKVVMFLIEDSGDFFTGQVISPNGGILI